MTAACWSIRVESPAMRSQLVTGAILEVSLTVGSFLEQILLTNFVRQCAQNSPKDSWKKKEIDWLHEIANFLSKNSFCEIRRVVLQT